MKTDILVIGGGPAGLVTATTAKGHYPDKKIIVVKSVSDGAIPCGIPYMFGTLKDPEKNRLSTKGIEEKGIEVIVDTAICINRSNKSVTFESGQEIQYDKLVLAIGSKPIVPNIKGIDKQGVYPIYKDMQYLLKMVEETKKAKNIVIVGGGFIGIEMADEIAIDEKNVYLVEMLDNVLVNAFDKEFCDAAAERLKEKGVKLLLNSTVTEVMGDEKVNGIKLSTGEVIDADLVVLGIGSKPNSDFAKKCGLEVGRGGGIWVNDYMRTSDENIFAVGDCAEKRDFFTREHTPVMLASTATAEARIAGANLFNIQAVRINHGTIAVFSTYVNGLTLGSAGLTEKTAKIANFDILIGEASAPDRHPGAMPDASTTRVRLIFSRRSKILLGGQVMGSKSVGEIINIIATAIQKRMTANEIATLQMATHPQLTAAPTVYPVVIAALNVEKMR